MKKTKLISLLASVLMLVISSCSKSSSSSGGGTGTCSWSCDIDGVHYSWSGTYPPTTGSAEQAIFEQMGGGSATILLAKGNNLNQDQVGFVFEPNPTSGTHNFNASNSTTTREAHVMLGASKLYSSMYPGSSINITIPSIPTKSFVSTGSAAGAGYFKGTFSGTMMNATGSGSINITNGQFEVMVLQND